MVKDSKMVIAVRKDLDLGKGKIAVQVAHAAVTLALHAKKYERADFKRWIKGGQKKVVIKIASLEELFSLKEKLESSGFYVCQISDAGYTQVPPNTVTCIGVGPADSEKLDPITSSYPLL